MKGRRLHRNPFDFWPTVAILGSANKLPAPDILDPALKTRIRVLSFEADIEKKNKGLGDRLQKKFLPTVVLWCARGFRKYRAAGELVYPSVVVAKTEEYFGRVSPLDGWLASKVTIGKDRSYPTKLLFKSYNAYRKEEELGLVTCMTSFGRVLKERGFTAKKGRFNGKMTHLRIGLEVTDRPDEDLPLHLI